MGNRSPNTLRTAYSLFNSFMGISLILLGIIQIVRTPLPITFYLLVGLGVLSQMTMTSFVEGNAGVSVSSAISLTTASLYGPIPAALVAAAAEIGLWVMQTYKKRGKPNQNWRKEAELLGVNVGMNSIAAVMAGLTLQGLATLFDGSPIISNTVPWIVAAIVGDQINLWLLICIIFLAHGARPLDVWRENSWAIPINVLVMSAGGALLASAVREFDLLGIAIFFLPIMLSAYSFRITVRNAKKQMENLEGIVALRTKALAEANEQLAQTNQQIEQTNLQLGEANFQLADANKQLESANEELQTLHMDKNAFLAVLTHDMRTPLTSIKGYASILKGRELEREQQIKISKVILNSQETLLDIVNNILEIEKYQSGTPIVLDCESFDLALLAKTAVESIEAPAMEKEITLFYEEVPDPVMVTADFSKIQRVLLNLISNAIKYTQESGDVRVSTVANGRYAIFSVQDTGYGIPEDELPTIFDRYSRVKGHQHIAIGTGLGLAIVKSLVEAHQGEISVTSTVDVGSTFTIKLPLTS